MDGIEIIETRDGSHSLVNKALNETYHSRHGARQESLHVFIGHGLDFLLQKGPKDMIHILEVGFGTGLNVLLTLQRALALEQSIAYISLESFPLDESIWSKLNYVGDEAALREWFQAIHCCEWNVSCPLLENFSLTKLHTTLQAVPLQDQGFDLVYYDAFAPNKQPEMWEIAVLEKVVAAMAAGAVFVTYCARGQLKRDLRTLGLVVETLPGPPGKSEMVRAIKY